MVLARLSSGCPNHRGRLPTCYSPVRGSARPEGPSSLHLHVLSTPPAFVLSQDQTLREELTSFLADSRAGVLHFELSVTSLCGLPTRGSRGHDRYCCCSADARLGIGGSNLDAHPTAREPRGAHAVEFSKTVAPSSGRCCLQRGSRSEAGTALRVGSRSVALAAGRSQGDLQRIGAVVARPEVGNVAPACGVSRRPCSTRVPG